jgi:2-C-methyl-D-erythritol 4-phosphate cytidylyltransferase
MAPRETDMTRVLAVVLAAGAGDRFGSKVPKQFVPLAGRPVAMHAVAAFRDAGLDPIVAASGEWRQYCCDQMGTAVIEGGASRADTVSLALAGAERRGAEFLLVHAATRPFVTAELLRHMVDSADEYDGLVTAERLVGGVLDRGTSSPADRNRFVGTGSPELLRVTAFAAALKGQPSGHTLAVEALVAAGRRVGLVDPGFLNLKITFAHDLALAERLLKAGVRYGPPRGPFPLAL